MRWNMIGKRLGIEIGHVNIKIIEGKKKGNQWEVIKQLKIPTPVGCVKDGYLKQTQQLIKVIHRALEEAKIKTKRLNFLVDSSEILLREIEVEGTPNKYLKELLTYQIEEYLPIKPEEYEMDFEVTETFQKDGLNWMKVLAVAAPKNLINTYVDLSKHLGLKIQGISIQAANLKYISSGKGEVLVVDIGGKTTDLTVIDQYGSRMSQKITFGTMNLSLILIDEFGNDEPEEVEWFKEKYAAIYKEETLKSEDLLGQYISYLIKESVEDELLGGIQDFINFYEGHYGKKSIEKVYLLGGGAYLKGLDTYMTQMIGKETQIVQQMDQVVYPEGIQFESAYFATLLGMMKGA